MAEPRTPVVALVGRRLPDNENLGLGYLMAALSRAGIRAERHVLNDLTDVESICRVLMSGSPKLIGLSLPDGGSAFHLLTLGELLHRRGFDGHITAGGGFATLARDWLLERYSWLDSVIRYAGEAPLVGLVNALADNRMAHDVPGVTTRSGDGPPAPVLDPSWRELWPIHENLPELLGHPIVHISTSRGCRGRCAYCGPASLLMGEREEGKRAGIETSTLRHEGVGTVKWRELDDVCDEMASLWHNRGVRYFYLVDEHPLPWLETEALDYLKRWRRGLLERQVGAFGLGCMMRSDRVTPEIIDSFAELGLIRAFVGLELVSPKDTRRFRRSPMGAHAPALLGALERHGIATITNLMLLHPYSTEQSIREGIEYLSNLRAGLFEATQMQVYHGTSLHRMLEADGRLLGNPLRYGYDFGDPVVERFAQIFTRLRAEAFHDYSVAYSTHDVWLGIALAERLRPEASFRDLRRRLRAVSREVNELHLRAFREALALARAGGGWDECFPAIATAQESSIRAQQQLDRLLESIPEIPSQLKRVFAPIRSAAAAAVQVVALTAPIAACSAHRAVEDDADVVTDADTDGDADVETDADIDEGLLPCTPEQVEAIIADARDIIAERDPCFTGWYSYADGSWDATVGIGATAMEFAACHTPTMEALLEEQGQAVADALEENLVLTCELEAAGPDVVEGETMQDIVRVAEQVIPDCFEDFYDIAGSRIVVDSEGRILEITHDEGSPDHPPEEVLECMRVALDGLVFPCLAGYEICPEFVIIE